MKQKIYDALINTSINNLVLNCVDKLKMVARFVDSKIDNKLDDDQYLIMRSYDLTDRDGNKFYVKCYYPDCEQIITCVEVEVIEENYETPKKVAKEVAFCPLVRVCVPTNGANGYTEEELAEELAREKLMSWTKSEILDWLFENLEDIIASSEPYDEEYDDCMGNNPTKKELQTKEEVFDKMENTLMYCVDKTLWFNKKNVVIQKYYGELTPHTIVSLRLCKTRDGQPIILQDADVVVDGETIREVDDVTHLSLEEMVALYDLMMENI